MNQYAPGTITLVTGERRDTYQHMHALIIKLALSGPVKLLIGGNRYNHYAVNYAVAAATRDYERILAEHIWLSRAETCYQMVELLVETPAYKTPTLAFDLLTTFYDEGINEHDVNHLLFEAILELRRLSQSAPVMISATPKQARPRLLKVLAKAADEIERFPTSPELPNRQAVFIW